jgi:hypothetical protein
MNPNTNADRILQDWLEEGPSELPVHVLGEISDRLDETPQRRPSWFPWITTGSDTMNRLLIPIAGLAAALVIAVGVYANVNGGPGLGAAPEPDGVLFTSERHGYTLVLPDEDWSVVEYPGAWLPGATFTESSGGVDSVFQTGASQTRYILFNSQEVAEGTSFEEWLVEHRTTLERAFPGCSVVDSEPIELGGQPATYDGWTCDTDDAGLVMAFHNGRAYEVRVFSLRGPQWDPRAVIDEWLPRFSFTD